MYCDRQLNVKYILFFTILTPFRGIEGGGGGRGVVAQSVGHAAPGEEVPGSIPTVAARSLLVGSVSVLCDRLRQKSWSPLSVSCVAARKIVRRLVVDEDVKKPTNQPTNRGIEGHHSASSVVAAGVVPFG